MSSHTTSRIFVIGGTAGRRPKDDIADPDRSHEQGFGYRSSREEPVWRQQHRRSDADAARRHEGQC
jgi:hypothetical protein